MTDKEWEHIIERCRKAGDEHKRLLKISEDEYQKRYGQSPSDVDDDWWIDSLHICTGDTDLQKIKNSAELHKEK